LNRSTYQFNRVLDKFIFKPLATTYQQVTPALVRTGVKNFFNNLDDVRVTFNDLLQLNFQQAASDLGRFAVNTTVGVGGLIDVAGPGLGLDKNRQDFGMTLAHYGVESGPYLVLPLLGPSTLRDAFGFGIDPLVDPLPAVDHVQTRNSLMLGKAIDFRARMLSFDDLVMGDEYLFIRGAYLQQREYAIAGGYVEVAFEDF
jgi:phospholipid-binding lipoprotein MlaA